MPGVLKPTPSSRNRIPDAGGKPRSRADNHAVGGVYDGVTPEGGYIPLPEIKPRLRRGERFQAGDIKIGQTVVHFAEIQAAVKGILHLPACPVATTVQVVGSKWKLIIIRNLLARPWRFNELRRDLEGISQKVLTGSLRSMEEDGVITRTVYPEVPPRVEYALSELGQSMRPILDAMQAWGENYKADMNA